MSKQLKTKKSVKPTTKIETLIHLIKRSRGATLTELQKATGWQAHSVRGAISGVLRKKLGLAVSVDHLLRLPELPVEWQDQRELLQFI